jgi:hypothetical protein
MACASWVTAVAAPTVGDMSEAAPGSSQHPDIPGAASLQVSGSPPTGRWRACVMNGTTGSIRSNNRR